MRPCGGLARRRILRTVGNSPETGMAMAGLYQLLQPVLQPRHAYGSISESSRPRKGFSEGMTSDRCWREHG